MPKRQYSDQYINFSFIELKNSGEYMPQCVMCMKTLSNASMKPSLLQRHLQSNHQTRRTAILIILGDLEKCEKTTTRQNGKQYQQSMGIVTASYEIALPVAKNKKPHTIPEELIMPAAKVLVKYVIGNEAV